LNFEALKLYASVFCLGIRLKSIFGAYSVFLQHIMRNLLLLKCVRFLKNFAAMSRVALKSVMMINDFDNFRKSVPVEKNCIG